MLFDMASFAGLARPLRSAITSARRAGVVEVPQFGATYGKQRRKVASGRR
jgi:hypothetical protein